MHMYMLYSNKEAFPLGVSGDKEGGSLLCTCTLDIEGIFNIGVEVCYVQYLGHFRWLVFVIKDLYMMKCFGC